MERTTVLKIGAELQEGPVFDALLDSLVALARERRLVVVHGGGAEIADLQQRLGLAPSFVDGLRVTDGDSLRVAQMVLSGLVNKRLTARLVARGVRALGLSGVDAGVLRARRLMHPGGDLGFVGEITAVDVACLGGLLDAGFTPVLSPISLGENGCAYNVNADHAALAVAGALGAEELSFTDVPACSGTMRCPGCRWPRQRNSSPRRSSPGNDPKVRSALEAWPGVAMRITNLSGLATGAGTVVGPSGGKCHERRRDRSLNSSTSCTARPRSCWRGARGCAL